MYIYDTINQYFQNEIFTYFSGVYGLFFSINLLYSHDLIILEIESTKRQGYISNQINEFQVQQWFIISFHHYVTIEISYNFHALQKLIINASSYEDKQGINMSLLRINCSKTCNLSLEINWMSMMQSCVWRKSIYQGHHRTTISHGILLKKYLCLFLYVSTNKIV